MRVNPDIIAFIRHNFDSFFPFLSLQNDLQHAKLEPSACAEREKELNEMLQRSEMNRQMQELLSVYLLLERYFMEESVLKAIALDNHEAGQLTSSMVDDVFFIIRKCIRWVAISNLPFELLVVLNVSDPHPSPVAQQTPSPWTVSVR